MPRRKELILTQPIRTNGRSFKVQLDHRTVITLLNTKALKFWKQRYPNAFVIN